MPGLGGVRHQLPTQGDTVAEKGTTEGLFLITAKTWGAEPVALCISPSHTNWERLERGKTNWGERAKTRDGFPPASKCGLHTNPPKTSPGRFYRRTLPGFRVSFSGTNRARRLLPALWTPRCCLRQGRAQHRGSRQHRDRCLAPALLQNPSGGIFSATNQLRGTVRAERGRILPAPGCRG